MYVLSCKIHALFMLSRQYCFTLHLHCWRCLAAIISYVILYNCCRLKIRLILSVNMGKCAQSNRRVNDLHTCTYEIFHLVCCKALKKVHCSYEGDTAYILSVLECTSVHENNIVFYLNKSKTCLKRWLKKGQKLDFNTVYRLMQVNSIAECSKRAFCNAFDLHLASICRSDLFCLFLSGRFRQAFCS